MPVVLLTGCGVAGTQFHPGVAAQVGDDTITVRHVDQVTDNYCKALEEVSRTQPPQGDQTTPLRYFSSDFVKSLASEAAARQLADELGIEPTKDYQDRLAQLEPQLEPLKSEAQKDAVRDVVGANAYTDDVLTQIGAKELEDQGQSSASPDDQLAAGQKKLDEWAQDHDVTINPKYATELGATEPVDTDLSFAVSDLATKGQAAQVDPAYADALPGDQVCLD
ncbi:hypothetical protein G5V58_17800 [Nocardioides anomalus]|uniref:Uncharacterized protein n=1 Tax=Nocardioides anomalus TaxID=2712223 RepID=A0A6G6WGM3_9ACTN|nr:hypothetical protein [Nocardioides anomalus]QIG44382.1 hypothetical protein G5V58_17800 [Nocardioides anomalus]